MVRILGVSHTHKRVGGGEGREQGQPATTNNGETRGANNKGRQQAGGAHNKQAEQRKEGGEGGGKKAHRNPTLARKRAGTIKHNRQQSKTTAVEKSEAGQHGKGTNTLLRVRRGGERGRVGGKRGKKEEERRDGKEKGGEVSQAMHAASMGPPGGREERRTQLYASIPEENSPKGAQFLYNFWPYGLLLSCDVFLSCDIFHSS